MIEIVTNLQIRGQFDDPRKLSKILPFKGDLYRSYYHYDESILKLIDVGDNYTNYTGTYYSPDLVIDIDGHNSIKTLELAKDKVKDAVNWLMGKGVDPDNFLVWFSGGGFHIHIPTSLFGLERSVDFHSTVRDTLLSLFPAGDNIYYPRALIRVGYSYNTKRRLWKIPLHHNELDLPIADIKELAQNSSFREVTYSIECFEPTLAEHVVQSSAKFHRSADLKTANPDNFIQVVTCMHKLYDRGPIQGRRHTDMLRLASWMTRAHMPPNVIIDSLLSWAPGVPSPEIEKVVNDVITKDYRYGCNDNVRMEYCDSRCIYFSKKDEGSEVLNQEDMNSAMISFALTGGYEHYINLESIIGVEYKIYPGEMVVITGPTGINKSTFAQQIAIENQDQKILYVSTEVDRKLMYRRFLQQVTYLSKEDLMKIFSAGNIPPGSDKLNHILIVDQMNDFEKLIQTVLQTKPTVVILDVMEDIGKRSGMDNIEINSPLVKQMAQNMGIILIVVAHMRKAPAGAFTRRKSKTLDDAKGSGALSQKSDKMILIDGDREDVLRTVHSAKARDEKPFNVNMILNINTFRLELYESE